MNPSALRVALLLAGPLVPSLAIPRAERAGAAAPAIEEAESSVRLTRAPLRAGDRIEARRRLERTLEYETSIDGEAVESRRQQDLQEIESTIEILAVAEGRPTRVRIRYEEWSESSTGEEGQDAEAEPAEAPAVELRGRTVVLEEQEDEVVIRDEDGAALDEEVEERVRALETDGGKRISRGNDVLAEWLAKEPRKIGEKLEVPAEVAREAFGEDEVERVAIGLELRELSEVDGERCAVFSATLAMKTDDDGFEVEFELEGEITWTIDGLRNVRTEWKGPVEIESEVEEEDVKVEISGAGTLEVEEDRAFSRED